MDQINDLLNLIFRMEAVLSNKVRMTKQRIKKTLKKRMRSYRKIMQFLWAFGLAGLALGCILVGWFGIKHQWKLAVWGIVYILVAVILLCIRNMLAYLDNERKRKRNVYSGPSPV